MGNTEALRALQRMFTRLDENDTYLDWSDDRDIIRAALTASRGTAMDIEKLAERCMASESCLPPAQYRMKLAQLHQEMLGEIERLRERVRLLEDAISQHNAEMDSMCDDKSHCGYAQYNRNCPNCPADYKIELATGILLAANKETSHD